MGLQERIIAKRHEDHTASGQTAKDCPLCRPLRLPAWRANLVAKDMSRAN